MSAETTPQPIVRDVILRDGSTLRLRSPVPDDRDAIKQFFDDLAPESRYMRFHGWGRTDGVATAYAQADGDARVAMIGRLGERIVAVAGYDRLREPAAAEVAFAVADDFQGRGVATRLLEQLAEYAAEHGVSRFDAEVLADNGRMLRVFRNAGFQVRREGMGDEVHLALDLRPTEELAARIARRDHLATVASLKPVLAPESVAIVGASKDPESVGGGIFANVVAGGFEGVATPVNRSGGVVRSVRTAARVSELADVPDLAIVAVPASEVLGAARDAAQAGVKALVVITSGFSESGEEGARLEDELLEVVRGSGLRLVGPNSLGVISNAPGVRLQATIGPLNVGPGGIAVSSQSGALGLALLGHAAGRHLGVASFVALGNRADVSTNDLLEYWEEDPGVDVIALYVESFGNPRRFGEISQRVSRHKPILAIKGNRTAFGRGTLEESASHTAAALREEAVVDALLRQAGVLRCGRPEELFDAAHLLASQPLPAGRRIAIVTNSGGLGTLGADAAAAAGLDVPELDDAAQAAVRAGAPSCDQSANPVDMGIGAGPDEYDAVVRALLGADAVDAVLAFYVQLSRTGPEAVLHAIDAAADGAAKPVAASILGAAGRPLRDASVRVPNLRFPESCVAALAHAAIRRDWLSRPLGQRAELGEEEAAAAREIVVAALAERRTCWLSDADARRLLIARGIAATPSARCDTPEDAVREAAAIGRPVAMKAWFEPPESASDIDAVLLGLEGEAAVRAAWEELERRVSVAGRAWLGAAVQPLVPAGADVLVGSLSDADLGPVVAVGLGGRQAGLARDVSFRLAALTDVDADELIADAPAVAAQLEGFRGAPPLDHAALRDLILRFAALLHAVPELVEVDLNPVRVQPEGAEVIDVRMRAEHRPARTRVKTW